jgi:hypothetical protein
VRPVSVNGNGKARAAASMRVFTRVVERRSFTLAAEDLALPRSTVTDAVKQLETRLGVRLLQRATRHVSPTLDGEAYHRRCLGPARLSAHVDAGLPALSSEPAAFTARPRVHRTARSRVRCFSRLISSGPKLSTPLLAPGLVRSASQSRPIEE